MTVAFYLPGGIPVFSFALLLGCGAVLGLVWISWRGAPAHSLTRIYNGLWLAFAALLGSRTAYVGINWEYYRSNPDQILTYPFGGLAWPGALIAGLLGLLVLKAFNEAPLGSLADGLLPLAVSLAIAAWMGCWLEGCAYGWPSQAWYAVPAKDEWGNLANRWPVQFVGALSSLALFWLVERLAGSERTSKPGLQACLLALLSGLVLYWLTLQRADPAPIWRGLRLESWTALGLAALATLALAGMLAAQIRPRRTADGA